MGVNSLNQKLKNLSLCFIMMFALIACTVPGGNIATRDVTHGSEEEVDLDEKVNVYSINSQDFPRDKMNTTEKTNPSLLQAIAEYDYLVGAGDVLNVTVWDHPELTIPAGSMRPAVEAGNWVHSDGTMFYPYVGEIKVAGLNVIQIRKLITERLSTYIEKPQVDVTIAAFKSQRVYVTGAVNQPGAVQISNLPLTLIEAVNASGGLSEFADWNHVKVTRGDQEFNFSLKDLLESGALSQNILLQHNDVIHVSRDDAQKVFVLGEVTTAQTLKIDRSGMTLAEAISSSGGFSEVSSDASGIFVVRKSKEAQRIADVYQLDASDVTALVLADQFQLEPRDIVYVTAAPIVRWNRVVSQLLPSAQILWYGLRMGVDGNTLANTLGE